MHPIYEALDQRKAPLAVVGLGYVGLPLAVHFSRHFNVIGYDISEPLIQRLERGRDETGEVDESELAVSEIRFTADPSLLAEAVLIIVTVPTPIDKAKRPNLQPLIEASRAFAPLIQPGAVIVYESTVYPGVTEEICGPLLEEGGLKSGKDFFLGYSPERINPGDKEHSIARVIKVVSGQTPEVTDLLEAVYGRVVEAGIHRAPSIKTAEAAKVIENTQRDLNIALMNELAVIFNSLGIDTRAVLRAAGTKWNFLNFQPGLVGGHCIGVDPYYLTHLAQQLGHHPQVILAGRRINDEMGKFVAEQTVKHMLQRGIGIAGSRILVLGLTFKQDVPDMRNSKVFDLIQELRAYQTEVLIHDPCVLPEQVLAMGQGSLTEPEPGLECDAVILAVKHRSYLASGPAFLSGLVRKGGVFVDIMAAYEADDFERFGLSYWRP